MSKKDFKVIFMGTPGFAVPTLETLNENYTVCAVVTAPDRPAGRGQQLKKSEVKVAAENLNLPVLQPEKLKDPEFLKELSSYQADLFVVVAFRMLPEVVWNMPPNGTINIHASLLPNYRGAAPINWAIINGEKESGVTTFKLQHEIDTGDLILQQKVKIDHHMNAGDLHDQLMEAGKELIIPTVEAIRKDEVEFKNQVLTGTEKHAPKIFKPDCEINWSESAENNYNKIRGLSPYPNAWSKVYVNGKESSIKIFASEIVEDFTAKDIYMDKEQIIFPCNSGKGLKITELQLAGKKRMAVGDLLRGLVGSNQKLSLVAV